MPLLEHRKLGSSALQLSVLGFGGAPLGGFRDHVDEAASDAAINAALSGGITYFDTAPLYGYGRSEHRLGHLLRNIDRKRFTLSTKTGRYLTPRQPGDDSGSFLTGGLPFLPVFDYSRDGILRSYEQSQSRLGFGQVDMLLIHDPDAATHGGPEGAAQKLRECLDGALPALAELRAAGEIMAYGVGTQDIAQARVFLQDSDIDCVMIAGRYSLLDQDALSDLLPECTRRQAGVLMAGPFNSGILATGATQDALYHYRPASPQIRAKTDAIEHVCTAHGVPLRAAALQFPLGHAAVCSVVAGLSTEAMVLDTLQNLQLSVPSALWSDLKAEGLVDAASPCPAPACSGRVRDTMGRSQ